MKPVTDRIGRPLNPGSPVSVRGTKFDGEVVGRTEGRRTLVDVKFPNGRVIAFYGTSLMAR